MKGILRGDDNDDNSGSASDGEVDAAIELRNKKKSKEKPTKIKSRDAESGSAIRLMRDAGASKISFDEDGRAIKQVELLDLLKSEKTKGTKRLVASEDERSDEDSSSYPGDRRIAEFTRKVRARLEAGREEDKEREQQRVREKHRDLRMKARGPRREADEEGEAVLLGAASGSDEEEQIEDSNSGREYFDNQHRDSDSDSDVEREKLALKMLDL